MYINPKQCAGSAIAHHLIDRNNSHEVHWHSATSPSPWLHPSAAADARSTTSDKKIKRQSQGFEAPSAHPSNKSTVSFSREQFQLMTIFMFPALSYQESIDFGKHIDQLFS